MAAAARTYYEVLELSNDAPPIDVKKAYRRLALKYHPDRNRGTAESTEQFKLISEAYNVLSDPTSRRSYDKELKYPASTVSPRQSNSRCTTTNHKDPFRQFDDLFRQDPFFNDAFEGMDDAFASRFNQSHVDKQEEVGGFSFFRCGGYNSNEKKQSLGEWVLNKLGIELTVTSYSTQADGTTTKSHYTSNSATGSTNKQSRTYVDAQGRKVTVMSMEKNGNVMEDMFLAGKLVERKVNGVAEHLTPTIKKESRDNVDAPASASSMDRID